MSTSSVQLPAPAITPETVPYWQAAEQGKLLIKRCQQCSQNHFYPRTYCPFCGSPDTVWLETSGRGTIYSFTVMRRGTALGAPAYVTLEEGPTIPTVIVECDFNSLKIGQRVRLTFAPTAGVPTPVFTPV